MTMSETSKEIKFARTTVPYGEDGSPLAATEYEFDLNGSAVTVRVHSDAIQTISGEQLAPDEVKVAAKALIEIETEKHVNVVEASPLVLDCGAMFVVARRLGWSSRFYRAASEASG